MSSTLTSLVPILDGTNYQQWAAQMQSYLMSQGQWKATTDLPPTLGMEIKEDEETKAKITVYTNQETVDYFEENTAKALGNIRLWLHHTIGYQYVAVDSPRDLWDTLKQKYAKPGISRAFLEFRGTLETRIPDGQDPRPAIDRIMAHFTTLSGFGFEIPGEVKAMMIIAKALRSMESVILLASEPDFSKLRDLEAINVALYMAWETSRRQGVINVPSNQQRANKLSVVKQGDQNAPQFQQRGDGTWQQRGRPRRGK